jgi:phosphohistidine phosphatase SixA
MGLVRSLKFLLTPVLLLSLFAQTAHAQDLAIWDKLQGSNPKGYVLLLRHALAPGVGDPENFRINDCSTQRNLSKAGRQDAKEIGNWLKRREIKILRVESSGWCRAKETAQLLGLGKVKINNNFNSLFQESEVINHPQTVKTRKQIVEHRNKNGLLILVGHFVNISALTGVGVESGEGVLVRADANGKIKVMGFSPKP